MRRLLVPVLVAIVMQAACDGNMPKAHAQVPSAPSQAKTPKTSKYVSAEGITIPETAKDAPAATVGAASLGGGLVTLSLRGAKVNGLLKYSGTAEHSQDGRLARGTTDLNPIKLMTSRANGTWIDITSFSIDALGYLNVTDANGGAYRIKFGASFDGSIEELRAPGGPKK